MNDRSPSPSTADGMTLIEHLPFDTDEGIASRARIGLMVLATDFTIEHEWRAIMAGLKGVALYESRILNDAQITPETLRAMEPRIAAATDVILPGSPIDVVAYGCTSASMAIGEEKVFERIREARPNARCTTPITAAFAAFRALKARRIGVLTGGFGPDSQARLEAFLRALAQLGWTEGQNVRLEIRRGGGESDTIRKHAAELAALAPDVIVAIGGTATGHLLQATRTVPIVFAIVPDPVGSGFVASL